MQSYSSTTSNKGLLYPVTIPKKINACIPTIAQGIESHCLFVTAMLTIVAVPAQPWPAQPFHILFPNRPRFRPQYGESRYKLSIYYLSHWHGSALHLPIIIPLLSFRHLFPTGNKSFQVPNAHDPAVPAIYNDHSKLPATFDLEIVNARLISRNSSL